jgi:hypothetical protein
VRWAKIAGWSAIIGVVLGLVAVAGTVLILFQLSVPEK